MIKKEFIQLNVEAEDWEDAIRQSANPLLKDGKITQTYVDKIVDIVYETGPYIVITKHVALPHAPVEFGALAMAMGITTLKGAVVFGHQTNDPVRYLFCMSAIDNETHLSAMAELVNLLSDEEFYQLLDTAETAEEILNYINHKCIGGKEHA